MDGKENCKYNKIKKCQDLIVDHSAICTCAFCSKLVHLPISPPSKADLTWIETVHGSDGMSNRDSQGPSA